jgi:hypothetical protein
MESYGATILLREERRSKSMLEIRICPGTVKIIFTTVRRMDSGSGLSIEENSIPDDFHGELPDSGFIDQTYSHRVNEDRADCGP